MGRILEQLLDTRPLGNLARIHDNHLLGKLGHDSKVVGDEQNRHAHFSLKGLQQVKDLRLDRHIQRGGGLIGNEETRLAGYGHRDHDPLFHSPRHLMRILVNSPFGGRDPHFLKQPDDFFPDFLFRESGMNF